MSRTLIDIANDLRALDDLLEEIGGDLTDPRVEAAISAWDSELANDLDAKADGYAAYIRDCELRAAAKKEEEERLAKGRKTLENRTAWLKARLKGVMESLGVKKAGKVRVCSVVNNGGKQPVQLQADIRAEELPPRFQSVRVDINTTAIYDALAVGEHLAFAELLPRGTHLRIN